MDIDDILADLDQSVTPAFSDAALDHQLLTRFWVSERVAPEVLRWPTDLMERVMSRVREQTETIEDMTAGMDERGASGSTTITSHSNLVLSILQTDLSRTQYMVRSLLRQRLAKLTRHAMHYLTLNGKEKTEDQLLSPQEQSFLQNHQTLLSDLYAASFLSAFPPRLQRLDDNAGGLNMVEAPDGRKAVFVRCLAERWTNIGSNKDLDEEEEARAAESGTLFMRRGQIWVVRWEDVKKGIDLGALELL